MTGEDITEREAQAGATAASEERCARLALGAGRGDRHRPAGRMQLANQAAEQMFGYSRAELVGQNVRMLMPAEVAGSTTAIAALPRHGRSPHHRPGRDVEARRAATGWTCT
jgi:PAS domain-containing protein